MQKKIRQKKVKKKYKLARALKLRVNIDIESL